MGLHNSQYAAIMRIYDDRQAASRQLQKQRYDEVRRLLPAYEALEDEITRLCALKARAAILGNSRQTEDFKETLARLEQQKTDLLTGAGYPADYLSPIWHCPDCRDTGYIGSRKCHCFRQAVTDVLYHQSGLSRILQEENFDHFDASCYSEKPDPRYGISPRENILDILKVCQSFAADFDREDRNLLFYGHAGVGKTFMTHCIADALLKTGHTVIYFTAAGLMDLLAAHAFDREDEEAADSEMLDYIRDCDLLIIDDLGTELNNAFVTSRLFVTLNDRLTRRRSTIISTNLSPDELQREYSERIFSRIISAFEIMMIMGDDIRIRRAIT